MLPTGETTYLSRKVKPEVVWTTGVHFPVSRLVSSHSIFNLGAEKL